MSMNNLSFPSFLFQGNIVRPKSRRIFFFYFGEGLKYVCPFEYEYNFGAAFAEASFCLLPSFSLFIMRLFTFYFCLSPLFLFSFVSFLNVMLVLLCYFVCCLDFSFLFPIFFVCFRLFVFASLSFCVHPFLFPFICLPINFALCFDLPSPFLFCFGVYFSARLSIRLHFPACLPMFLSLSVSPCVLVY